MRWLRRWGRLALVDTTPLRQVRGYRWLFGGMLLAQTGRQLTVVAVPIQVFQLTDSTLMVGLLGLAQLLPLLAMSVLSGALVDAVDRRLLLVISQLVLALSAVGLLLNATMASPAVWPLFALSGLNAAASAVDFPARHAIVPGLVGRTLLPAALALNQTLTNTAKGAVPAFAGLLIAAAGLPATFAIEAGLFLAGALVIRRVPRVQTEGGGRRVGLTSIAEGFRFLRSRRVIQAAFLIDLNAMVFGMPTALFPEIGTEVYGGNEVTVGLLYAAPGVGALIGALTSGWVGVVQRHGRATVIAVIGWGLSISVFGLSRSLVVGLLMLALAGAADVASAIFRGAIVQLSTPDALRGRLAAMHTAISAGGPRLGDLESGIVAALTSVRFSVVSGGIACIAAALAIGRWAPGFMQYRYDPGKPDARAMTSGT